ncbi:MAG: KpsF/GutQ family sugar-phosphate isomerase [Tepidisphaeraceae bacterium]|jgi:arabinose-5-phosphate isomerase
MDESTRQYAREIMMKEADAVGCVAARLDEAFDRAVRLLLDCGGAALTSGVGKAGFIARKLSATLASTGTPSHFLNPGDALHGDVGSIRRGDVVILLSYSGESDEIVRMLSVIRKLDHPVIAITGSEKSSLARFSDVVLQLGKIEEACPLGLAPSATTTAMLALGDALALTVMKLRNFTDEDFALFHPAGQLGRKLIRVREAMTFRKGENLPLASDNLTVAQVLHHVSHIKRRSGAVVLVDEHGKLSGIFADSDLRRLLTDGDGSVLSRPIAQVMTRNPKRVHQEALASQVMALMKAHRIDEVPVVDDDGAPVGLIDVQDLVVLKLFDVDAEM